MKLYSGEMRALLVRGSHVQELGVGPVLEGAALPLKEHVCSLGVGSAVPLDQCWNLRPS